MSHPPIAYKIFTAAQWGQFQADGVFAGAPVDLADGYIHLSTADQLQGTLDKHFAGQTGLVIAEIELQNEKDEFCKPSWLGEEVTSEEKYYNAYLSNYPYTSWK